MPRRRASTIRSRGFSIIELVMVIGILGFVSAIAIPRISAAAETARASTLAETQVRLQRACDLFSADHFDLSIAEKADGSIIADSALSKRLLVASNATGDRSGIYGPYLASVPVNPYNGLNSIRITASGVRKGTHGWMFVTGTREILPDHDLGGPIVDIGPAPKDSRTEPLSPEMSAALDQLYADWSPLAGKLDSTQGKQLMDALVPYFDPTIKFESEQLKHLRELYSIIPKDVTPPKDSTPPKDVSASIVAEAAPEK